MNFYEKNDIHTFVQDNYARVATEQKGCGCGTSCCPTSTESKSLEEISHALGYSSDVLENVPAGANMGLGCGNPHLIASLKAGERVLDLGSGAGVDVFLAAKEVGEKGYVIGVDMTPEMVEKARSLKQKSALENVDFRLGFIEQLPVEDASIDVVISNCVINLSPDKQKVFHEIFRVLKPQGRMAISDIVATQELPEKLKNDMALHVGCMAGASQVDALESYLHHAGFEDIRITLSPKSKMFIKDWAVDTSIEEYVSSATIEAKKPS